jgi:hypothetical protein
VRNSRQAGRLVKSQPASVLASGVARTQQQLWRPSTTQQLFELRTCWCRKCVCTSCGCSWLSLRQPCA